MRDGNEKNGETAEERVKAELESIKGYKNPEARAAAAVAVWQPYRKAAGPEFEKLNRVTDVLLEKAWSNANTRRMTLMMLRTTRGWDRLELAKLLGVSAGVYTRIEYGRHPLSRESLQMIAAAKELSEEGLNQTLLMLHAMMIEIDTSWEMRWQERLAPLSAQERREEILRDKDLHNWGLSDLLCEKCLAAEDPHEAVALAELAVLVAEHLTLPKPFRDRHLAYAWGHLGHALQRRGNQAAAEAAFAESIEIWTNAGKGIDREDRERIAHLVSLVPGFPPYQPPPRKKRKPAKRKRAK